MITKDQVIPMILEACPSFQEIWNQKDQDLLYVAMGNIARHLLALYEIEKTDEFSPLGQVIEQFHLEGDKHVRELATIGFLEGIHNVWENNGTNPEEFCRFLLPESRKWWKEINDFWAGKIPYVGAGLHN